jgi:hypothetical protein
VALLLTARFGLSQDERGRHCDDSVATVKERPVVQWTVGRDAMNFRYNFLKNVKTTTLLYATPTRTSFPDACARSNAGRLPDGQVYVINNVLPLSAKKGGRSLLAISLSRDGLNFDRMAVICFIAPPQRYAGRAKSGGYAYPHSVVAGDYLWMIYSVNKEDIEIARIPLSELEALK